MTELDLKIIENFPGKIVRKDLTHIMKQDSNVPTYVLEYLLGMYCSTDDEDIISAGMEKIKKIIAENYVRPDQSEFIKSRIKENGTYTIIDKISVYLNEREDKYIATFTNLKISPFEVSSSFVVQNEKLLTGGIWCILNIAYKNAFDDEEDDEGDIFGSFSAKKKVKKKKSKFDSPFTILNLKPIQMPTLNINDIIDARENFTKDEWITLLLRSCGYEPSRLSFKQRLHYLLRFVPFVQKNYNLVELGPRGTGKSHVYSELSPYSILMSSGTTTVSNMFYNMQTSRVGLVGHWDCVAFDEVAGLSKSDETFVQTMKNYMANGSFARGTSSINADASIVLEGNTFRSISAMLQNSTLFEPFPDNFNGDSAFFDRIHAYLPGWETLKLSSDLFTKNYGLISDCFAEFCHAMRFYDFTNDFADYFALNSNCNVRDEVAIRRTFGGLVKLIYPNRVMDKEEVRELLEYSIECRRRVKEQLKRMNPLEFNKVNLGYLDLESNEEYIIELPEQPTKSLIQSCLEPAGHVYAVGASVQKGIALYRLENKAFEGTGKFDSKNIEGLSADKYAKTSLQAAFNYFAEHSHKIINTSYDNYDYALYFNDLQNKGVSEEVSVAEVVGLFSALTNRSVMPGVVICGRVVMSGSMMPLSVNLEQIMICLANSGAKKILLPNECYKDYESLSVSVKGKIQPIFYSTPIDAAKKALGLEE